MKVKRENFKKMVCRHYGGFTFQAEWWNMVKNKDANYRDWFLDVIVAVGVFGIFLEDMPDKMKIDMEDVIDCLYNETCAAPPAAATPCRKKTTLCAGSTSCASKWWSGCSSAPPAGTPWFSSGNARARRRIA